jgi:hypothetical protein
VNDVRHQASLTETVHAVVYFAPEPQQALADTGLRGFWRGYFAARASPLGPASAELITALFAGFAPAMVGRAVPEVWSVAPPAWCWGRAPTASTPPSSASWATPT